jgi:SAM-dependent methyltransferase
MSRSSDAGEGDAPLRAAVQPSASVPAAVEEVFLSTVRTLALTMPAPRYDPYYGIDRADGPSLRLLERLSRHGDFRKYVHVLDVGCGWGGPARWLALRYGCRVVALDVSASVVALADRLSRRAGLGAQVRGVAASCAAVPARDGAFTQIWCVEALQHARDRRRVLAELFRVLRPGSPLALQEIVRAADAVPAIGGAWRHGTLAEHLEALASVGFTGVEHDDVTAERAEISPVVLSARERFRQLIHERLPADAPWLGAARARAAVAATVTGPDYRTVQLFARRPSV